MKFYTIQKRSVWNKWKKQGFMKASDAKHDLFEEAYVWMRSQMRTRLKGYKGEPIIWLWTERPTWYKDWIHINRKKFVLLTVELNENEVVYSDFDAWHIVLNNTAFDDGESWERVFDLKWIQENFLESHEKQRLQATAGVLDIGKVTDVKYFTNKKK